MIDKIGKLKTQKAKDRENLFKSMALSIGIFALAIANLIFFISMVLQILNATGGEIVETPKTPKTTAARQQEIREQEPVKTESIKRLISVEILNGCGVNGVAGRLREYLIANKFDVVDFKNYDNFKILETLVIDRVAMDKRNAEKVAAAIGVRGSQIIPQLSTQRKLDVTVIIGKDYPKLKAFKR